MRNKIKELVKIVKIELIICIAVPIMTAVLLGLGQSQTMSKDLFYMLLMGLFCVLAYGVIKMYFKLKSNDVIVSEENLNKPKSTKYRIFVFIAAVILPLVGLSVNSDFLRFSGGVIADFSSPWFYIIAVLNGVIMLFDIKDSKLSLLLFYLKIVGFTYISYFTIVFIPLIPLGFIGIILYGLGLLIFIPATVFITELFQILQDIRRLKPKFDRSIIAVIIIGFVTLPTILAVNFYIDKVNFNNAMRYLSAEAGEMPAVSISRLSRAMSHMDAALDTRSRRAPITLFGDDNIPIISAYYQNTVFENKLLAPDTMQKMSVIFFGVDNEQPINAETNRTLYVDLVNASTRAEYDSELGIYKTWVDLEITNNSGRRLAEYKTQFTLPDGCFIKDYYLYVGNERKQGILTDKRAALIVYNNILRTPKDPGIIYYTADNQIELRVYPFSAGETRKTGFWVWHSQSERLSIDGVEIELRADMAITEPISLSGVSFVPASYKEQLPALERSPRYYFVIDASENSPYNEHIYKINDYLEKTGIDNAAIYAASYRVYANAVRPVRQEGGFNLPLAMEMIFNDIEHGFYPIIIAVSDNLNKSPTFQKNDLAKRFPDSEYYYNLGYDLSLTPYSFADNKRHDTVNEPIISSALNYNGLAVSDNGRGETILHGELGGYTDNAYHNAFILQGKCSDYSNDSGTQIDLIRQSFRQRLLTKYTGFIVVETKEQENDLMELQARFMNEGGEVPAVAVVMSEPGGLAWVVFGLVFVVVVVVRRRGVWG
ncbi:MAG: MSEP-CTERM sorting domain-containing protein [Defluviitaleaceae bacterium]|nr:MSEP-CTERM sorting domain-containing protein [Defluviitaleaceae bacterium]